MTSLDVILTLVGFFLFLDPLLGAADDNRRRPAYSPRYCVDNVTRFCSTLSPLINAIFVISQKRRKKHTKMCVFCIWRRVIAFVRTLKVR